MLYRSPLGLLHILLQYYTVYAKQSMFSGSPTLLGASKKGRLYTNLPNNYHVKPKRISPLLDPLVSELLKLWEGVSVPGPLSSSITLPAALLCFVSDIPATKNVCGFPGFKARLGCSKCLKPCKGFGERTDYSGYDHPNWVTRTKEQHLNSLAAIEKATSPTERQVFHCLHYINFCISILLDAI